MEKKIQTNPNVKPKSNMVGNSSDMLSSRPKDSTQFAEESHVADGADFLLSNSKYHDCFLVVGNPDTDEVESIGAASLQLIAHSPVLREMLEHNRVKGSSESQIHVTDVSPATFKLMLRFVYGGKLPQMTAIEAAGLALCADKFKIPRLVQKALKWLNPTSAKDVFPALICVSYINFSDLEIKVEPIVQQQTKKIVENFDFLELDEDCVIFILKQSTLNISELEIWKSVVCWAEYQVKLNPRKTARDCLIKIFGYVRFLTLTLEEILEHVLPTKILSSEEFMDLILTVTKKQAIESPLLCKIQERRKLYKEKKGIKISADVEGESGTKDNVSLLQDNFENVFGKACIFKIADYYNLEGPFPLSESTFKMKPKEPIEIVSFTCESVYEGRRSSIVRRRKPNVICNITVTKTVKDVVVSIETNSVEKKVRSGEYVILPIKLRKGRPLVLNPEETCTFTLRFNRSLYACNLSKSNDSVYPLRLGFAPPIKKDNITFTDNRSSVLQIDYRKQ